VRSCALVEDGGTRAGSGGDMVVRLRACDGWLVTWGSIIKGVPIINVYLVGIVFL
jgi:hypothetical protein